MYDTISQVFQRYSMYHILTHAIFCNYGGILQAYTLQTTLHNIGVPCTTIDYLPTCLERWMQRQGVRSKLRHWGTLLRILEGSQRKEFPLYFTPLRHIPFKKCFMQLFPLKRQHGVVSNMPRTTGFIVRSDQVWRGVYARDMQNLPFYSSTSASRQKPQASPSAGIIRSPICSHPCSPAAPMRMNSFLNSTNNMASM